MASSRPLPATNRHSALRVRFRVPHDSGVAVREFGGASRAGVRVAADVRAGRAAAGAAAVADRPDAGGFAGSAGGGGRRGRCFEGGFVRRSRGRLDPELRTGTRQSDGGKKNASEGRDGEESGGFHREYLFCDPLRCVTPGLHPGRRFPLRHRSADLAVSCACFGFCRRRCSGGRLRRSGETAARCAHFRALRPMPLRARQAQERRIVERQVLR